MNNHRNNGGGRRRRPRSRSSESYQSRSNASSGFFSKVKSFFSGLFGSKPSKSNGSFNRNAGPAKSGAATHSSPKPELVLTEVTSSRLYVGNLSYDTVESDLFDLFSKEGSVKNVEVIMDRRSNRCKGFGFVEMESLEKAIAVSQKLNRTEFMGRQILVMGAKSERREREQTSDNII